MKNTILAITFFIFGWSAPLSAEVMTYQGRLKESNVPVNANRAFLFELCATETPTGCVPSPDGAKPFAVQNGLFKSTFTIPAVDLSAGPWYLRVQVEGSYLSPVEKLTFVPYSLYASTAGYSPAALQKAGDTMTGQLTSISSVTITGNGGVYGLQVSSNVSLAGALYSANGNVGIGTAAPQYPLVVLGNPAGNIINAGDAANPWGATAGFGLDDFNTYPGAALYVNNAKVFNVESNGGAILGSTYMTADAVRNGLIVQGHVGIGTALPNYALEISSGGGEAGTIMSVSTGATNLFWVAGDGAHSLKFTGDGSGLTGVTGAAGTDSSKLPLTGGTMTGGLTLSGSTLTVTGAAFSVGGSTLVVANGNVGIGTATPAAGYELHVLGQATDNGDVRIESGSGTSLALSALNAGYVNIQTALGVSNGGDLVLQAAAGNVGIGMVSPGAMLDVAGSGNFSGSLTALSSGTFKATGPGQFSVETSSGILVQAGRIQAPAIQLTNGAAANYVLASDAVGNATWVNPAAGGVGDGLVGNEVTDAANTSLTRSGAGTVVDPYQLALNLSNANNWTAAQTFNAGLTGSLSGSASQNVLKAGDTMVGPLTLAGSTLTVTGDAFSVGGSTLVVTGGYLGLGTNSPAARLDVVSDNGYLHFRSPNTSLIMNMIPQTYAPAILNNNGDGPLGFSIANDVKMWIDRQTLVGIGTQTPAYRLHVSSAAGEAGIIMAVSTGITNVFWVDGSGANALKFTGDGSGLTGVTAAGAVQKSGDTMTGDLMMAGASTITVAGSGFSVGGSTFAVTYGRVGIGTAAPGRALDVQLPAGVNDDGIRVTARSGIRLDLYSNQADVNARNWSLLSNNPRFGDFSVRRSNSMGGDPNLNGTTAMYLAREGNIGFSNDLPLYRLHVSSGAGEAGIVMAVSTGTSNIFWVAGDGAHATSFFGDGSALTGVSGTDDTKLPLGGGTLTGQLTLSASTLTVISAGSPVNSGVLWASTSTVTPALFVSTTGRVGIGSASPGYPLHVIARSGQVGIRMEGYDTSADSIYIDSKGSGKPTYGYVRGGGLRAYTQVDTSNRFNINVNNQDRMTVTPLGLVGINDLSPAYLLHVSTTAGETGTIMAVSTGATNIFTVDGSGVNAIRFTGDGSGLTNLPAPGGFVSKAGDTMIGQLTNTSSVTITGNGGGAYGLEVSSNISLAGALYSSNGNVGIGTLNPQYGLDIGSGTNGISQTMRIKVGGGGADKASILLSGPVYTGSIVYDAGNASNITIANSFNGGDPFGNILFQTNGTSERLRITRGGNVGIGATAPDQKLTVAGNISQTGVLISSGAGDNYFAGNVGIGTAGQGAKLHVVGGGGTLIDIDNPDGTIGGQLMVRGQANPNRQLWLGYDTTNNYGLVQAYEQTMSAKPLVLQPNSGNVGIGATAPDQKLTVAGNISQTGVLISSGAGSNYFAGDVTAARYQIGGSTVLALLPGIGSMAVGPMAGAVSAGAYNLFIGSAAGKANSSGLHNVLVGYGAGQNNLTGTGNTFIGSSAGSANSTGLQNIVIGYNQQTSASDSASELNIGGVLFGRLGEKAIGISTRAPQAALDVVSTGTAANVYAQIWRDSTGLVVASMTSTGRLSGDGSGLVGISATDATKLPLNGGDLSGAFSVNSASVSIRYANEALYIADPAGGMIPDIRLARDAGSYWDIGGAGGGTPLVFQYAGNNRLFMSSDGYLTINDAGQVTDRLKIRPGVSDAYALRVSSSDGVADNLTLKGSGELSMIGPLLASDNISAARYQINESTVLAVLPGIGSLGIGFDAGTANYGDGNLFVGIGAGKVNNSGINNSFLGSEAGYNNTTGMSNLFIGYYAGRSNIFGSNNSFAGSQSGFSNTGDNNSFFGSDSGLNNNTGSGNVFIGAKAGYNSNGTGNIVIGYNKDTSVPAADYELNIGGLLYGDLTFKTIGISTRVPQAALDIVSTGSAVNQYAQIWRDSTGLVVASMTATGRLSGDGSGLTGVTVANGVYTNAANTFNNISAPVLVKPFIAPGVDTKLLDMQATGAGVTNFSVDSEGDVTTTGELLVLKTSNVSTSKLTLETDNNANNILELAKYGSSAGGSTAGGTILLANLSRVAAGATAGPLMMQVVSNNPMYFVTNDSERMRIAVGGNVGIAAPSPTGLFQVGGGSLTVLAGGNVGIGTTAPSRKLEVNGEIAAARYEIGGSTVVAILPGTESLGVGVNAGRTNTGNYNLFVGSAAGYSNTTGMNNSFLGISAGYWNTTASNNSFLGASAGYNNSGTDNSFMGSGAGYYNTGGTGNSFFGASAGYANNTGSQNSLLGVGAGLYNQAGSGDVILGYQAGGNGSGSVNSFSSSTVVGYQAGYLLRSGSADNILVGFRAGYSVTTGTGNIIIGYGKDTTAPGANNELNIGGVLYGDLSARTIGISRKVPEAALDIVSTATSVNIYAQIWRDSTGLVVASMTSTGRLSGDGSGLTAVSANDATKLPLTGGRLSNWLEMGNNSTMTVTGNAFSVGGSTLVVDAGRVGINTLPDSISGLKISGSGTYSAGIDFNTGGSDWALYNSAGILTFTKRDGATFSALTLDSAGKLQVLRGGFQVGGSTLVVNNGVVAVNTAAPLLDSYPLYVQAAGENAIYVRDSGANVRLTMTPQVGYDAIINADNSGAGLSLRVTDNPVLYLSSAGFAGVGTTAPKTKFEVLGGSVTITPLATDSYALKTGPDGVIVSTGGAIQTTGLGHGNTAGGARGVGAVDLQTSRAVAGQVASGLYSVLGGGSNNQAAGPNSTVGGGSGNTSGADYSTVSGGRENTVSQYAATVSGGWQNSAASSYASVSGGVSNTANGFASSVSGGRANTASGENSFVGGGGMDSIGGGGANIAQGKWSAVVGGNNNTASQIGAAVIGGEYNVAKGANSFIGGGGINVAAGWGSVAFGANNASMGDYTFAAGKAATSAVNGTFTWADSSSEGAVNNVLDQVMFKAKGGFWVSTGTIYANPALYIDASNNIGIGTAFPTAKLHLANAGDGIKFPDGSLMTTAGVGSASNLANITEAIINGDSDSNLTGSVRLQTAGLDRLYVSTNGNVGIGTIYPLVNLHNSGPAILANNTSIDVDTYGQSVIAGQIIDTGFLATSGVGGRATSPGATWGIGHNNADLLFAAGDSTIANTMQIFMQATWKRNLALVPVSGSVGVGLAAATVPDQKLTVIGNISQTGVLISSGTGNSYFAGNVGIGTPVPVAMLDVNGTARLARQLVESRDAGGTMSAADSGKTITVNSASPQAIMLPVGTAGTIGAQFTFVKLGAGKVTITAGATDFIADSSMAGGIYNDAVSPAYATITLRLVTSNQWMLVGGEGAWVTQ